MVSVGKPEFFSISDGQSTHQKYSSSSGKSIIKSGTWNLINGGNYYPVSSGPMIQVKSSGVTVDLQNFALTNTDTNSLVIGIEVGYSKAELDADPTLQQISNVTIKNGCFINFDVGIIVHQGVNTITIENCSFDGISYGVILLGTYSTKNESTIRSSIKNCTIIGHGLDMQERLIVLKGRIEDLYGYGPDSFMPFKKDIFENGHPENVYSYGGVIANYVFGLTIENTRVQNIGYQDYSGAPEGAGRRTGSIGILSRRGAGVLIKSSYIYSCASEVKAVGVKIEATRNVTFEDTECIYQKSAGIACGIEILDDRDFSSRYSLRERTLYFKNVLCHLNSAKETEFVSNSPEIAAGISVKGLFSIQADKLVSEGHTGKKKSYGFKAYNLMNSCFSHCVFNKNKSSRDENDVASDLGITAFGFMAELCDGLIFNSCDFSNNVGKNTGIGLCLLSTLNTELEYCTFLRNKGLLYKKNELGSSDVSGSIRSQQDTQEISNYGPVVESSRTGGYGCVVELADRTGFLHCTFRNNDGHRAVGLHCRNSSIVAIQDTTATYQHAYGQFLHQDFSLQSQGGQISSSYDIPVMDVHKSMFFHHMYPQGFSLSTINLLDFTFDFLVGTQAIRSGWAKDQIVSLQEQRKVVRTISLLQSLIARFRMWGIACGVHMHNCGGILIKRCNFSGQISDYDNAIGCVVTGRSADFYMENSSLEYNCGWKKSNKESVHPLSGYEYRYDLSAIKPFWNVLMSQFSKADSEDSAGFLETEDQLIAQGHQDFDGAGDDVYVVLKRRKLPFVNVIAPVSSGLVLADCCSAGTLVKNSFHGNKGAAGYCTGLLFHQAENFLVQENVIDDNASNIYGHCCGLMDVNLYSENSFIKNHLSFNRVDGFYNSHSLIIADTRSKLSSVYPKVELNNKNTKVKSTELDNIEVIFPSLSYTDKKESKKKDD